MPKILISIDGLHGTGKSTLIRKLLEYYKAFPDFRLGYISENFMDSRLSGVSSKSVAQTMTWTASRLQEIQKKVTSGLYDVILCDRSILTSTVYNHNSKGLATPIMQALIDILDPVGWTYKNYCFLPAPGSWHQEVLKERARKCVTRSIFGELMIHRTLKVRKNMEEIMVKAHGFDLVMVGEGHQASIYAKIRAEIAQLITQ